GVVLLRRDLCRGDAKAGTSSLRSPSTSMPLMHLQFMHAVLSKWVQEGFSKPAWLAKRRQAAIDWMQRALPLDPTTLYGAGLLVCGPFCTTTVADLEGPKNRLLVLADGPFQPKNAARVLHVDPDWERNMDAMAAQLGQAWRAAYECLFCRAVRFM